MVGIVALLVLFVAPLAWGLAGWLRARAQPAAHGAVGGDLLLASMLLFVLAFNLTFFVQELFLVLPKALVPGLQVTLFHNNHTWQGDHALVALLQGTGALATLFQAVICCLLLRVAAVRSPSLRLFLIWMAYCGFFMALPQVVVGALEPRNDVGTAMQALHFGAFAKNAAALLALAAMPLLALALLRPLLGLAGEVACIATPAARARFVFRTALLPALLAVALIVPFRLPREWIEVVLPPLVVALVGTLWMQAGAWWCGRTQASGPQRWPVAWVLAADLLVLLVFQLVLRPGIRFA